MSTTITTAANSDKEMINAVLNRAVEVRHAVRACAFNTALFARLVLGIALDAKQTLVLSSGARQVIFNCSRQWGKSTLAAIKILHLALTKPGSLALVISENVNLTSELFQKLDGFFEVLEIPAKTEAGKRVSRVLPNGSRILGLAAREAAGRGYTADFVFIDEAARIPDEVMDALLPVIAVRNGDWWMASTPMGRRGRYFEMWEYGGPEVLKVGATWRENPRLAPGFIDKVRKMRGDAFVQQEFEGQFVENGQFLLDQKQVTGVFVP